MAADSSHYQIEGKIRSKTFVYDYEDFADVIRSKGNAILMDANDFVFYRWHVSWNKIRRVLVKYLCYLGCIPTFPGKQS